MFGMIPYTFTVTSHIIVTFVLAAFIFIGVTVIGFIKHGFGYLKLFVPSGVPAVLLPLIVVIEIISYLSRPISLSVRLFANMMAGHTLLVVLAGFGWMMMIGGIYLFSVYWVPLFIVFLSCRFRNNGGFYPSLCFCNFMLYLY